MTWYEYKLAAGWNNTAGYANIETITPTGDTRPFMPPDGWSQFDNGLEKLRLDELGYFSGFATTTWVFAALSRLQYAYLRSTYTLGGAGYRGKVTVRTVGADGKTFGNYNAMIVLPKLSDVQRKSRNYPDVKIRFMGLVAI